MMNLTESGKSPASISKSNKRWDFDLYVSGFWHIHAKTPRGIVDC